MPRLALPALHPVFLVGDTGTSVAVAYITYITVTGTNAFIANISVASSAVAAATLATACLKGPLLPRLRFEGPLNS